MKRMLASAAVVLGAGLSLMACSDSDSGFFGTVISASLENATPADLSGQTDVFVGDLGSGVTFTFPAVANQNYLIQIDTTDSGDEVTFEVFGDNGSFIESRSVDSGNGFIYTQPARTQHVLVLCRPRNPFDSITVTGLTVTGIGTFPQDRVHVNVFVAGRFTGFGLYNDLVTLGDRDALIADVMARVATIFQQSGVGITVSHMGYSYDGSQIPSNLLGPDNQAICSAGESVGSTGFQTVDTTGLNQWAPLGFAANDPDFNAGHGINLFIINHFTTDGTLGLSPRPGNLAGNGTDSAVCVGAFLQQGGLLFARSVDELATVVAHEIGHFLGLLHTTTFSPNPFSPNQAIDDGLADTPRCTQIVDVNGDGLVGVGDGCPDESNLMFFQANNQQLFSNSQGNVMRTLLSVQEH